MTLQIIYVHWGKATGKFLLFVGKSSHKRQWNGIFFKVTRALSRKMWYLTPWCCIFRSNRWWARICRSIPPTHPPQAQGGMTGKGERLQHQWPRDSITGHQVKIIILLNFQLESTKNSLYFNIVHFYNLWWMSNYTPQPMYGFQVNLPFL